MLAKLAGMTLAASVLAVAAPAAAQEDASSAGHTRPPMGLRFETAFTQDFNIATIGAFGADAPGVSTNSGFSPNGDIKIGYDLPVGFTPLIGLGFLNRSIGPEDASDSVTAFILDVEARYYFKPHRGNAMQPYVFGEFNTAFTSVSTDADNDEELEDALGDATDFTELNAGLGMEYKFSGASFAVGGKWGLGLAWAGISDDTARALNISDESQSDTTFATSAAIYAAWRL